MHAQLFFASAPRHLGSLLAQELTELGIQDATETRGGAQFHGSLSDAYRACLWSRVANRILMPLSRFRAETPDQLYAGASAIPWEQHLALDSTFAIQLDGEMEGVAHSHFAALRVKDAIADRFITRLGKRPNVDATAPDLRIHVYLHRGEASLSLDLSGESLHRRGYRQGLTAAPLKENLAAAILLRAGWPQIAAAGGALLDPMCGSGTLVIEGALIAADIAPGLLRARFGFMGWLQHDEALWQALLEEARVRRQVGLERIGSIRGYDQDPTAIRTAIDELERAGLTGSVHFERRELSECQPGRTGDKGLLVVNPPYGERLGDARLLPALYSRLGSVLKERFPGWQASVLLSNTELGMHLGLRAHRQHHLYNGPIECRLLHFSIAPSSLEGRGPRALPAEERGEGAVMLANRLRKNLRALKGWRDSQQVTCFRLYDADLPEYAIAIDVYEGAQRWVHIQEYAAPPSIDPQRARTRLHEAIGVIEDVLEVPRAQRFFKVRRPQKGTAQYERIAETRRFHEVREAGLRFLVNFEDYLDTGLFLDHRDIRRTIGRLAAGRRFLNLFAYTATATVHAAAGGALMSTSVDMSRTYLDWARENFRLNELQPGKHELLQADCLQWLEVEATHRLYDLIFLDPPSFSSSKRMHGTLDIQRDHVRLIRASLRLLSPGGILLFSNNRRTFRMDVEALSDLSLHDITRETLPRDFARNPRIHHCWRIERRATVEHEKAH